MAATGFSHRAPFAPDSSLTRAQLSPRPQIRRHRRAPPASPRCCWYSLPPPPRVVPFCMRATDVDHSEPRQANQKRRPCFLVLPRASSSSEAKRRRASTLTSSLSTAPGPDVVRRRTWPRWKQLVGDAADLRGSGLSGSRSERWRGGGLSRGRSERWPPACHGAGRRGGRR
jgi:hypothetical protein